MTNTIVYRNYTPHHAATVDGIWYQVTIPPERMGYFLLIPSASAVLIAMKEWCSKNTLHQWTSFGSEFFFEDPQDAMWFTLKWE